MEFAYTDELLAIAVPVLVAILGYISKVVEAYFKKKKDQIDEEIELKKKQDKDDRLLKYMGIVAENAQIVVTTLNADIVENLKKASVDGKLTEEEIVEITKQAVLMLSNSVSNDAKELLTEFVGDLNDYFTAIIKSTVEKVKK